MENNKAIVVLTITDFMCDPEEIGRVLKLTPSKIWKKGAPILAQRPDARKYEFNGWRLEVSSARKTTDDPDVFQEALAHLISEIAPLKDRFSMLPIGAKVELSCHIYASENCVPIVNLDTETIQFLSAIGAAVDIDMYVI